MRYSVFTTFHVEACDKETATASVNAALDFLFCMHRAELATPGAHITNATVTRSKCVTQEA